MTGQSLVSSLSGRGNRGGRGEARALLSRRGRTLDQSLRAELTVPAALCDSFFVFSKRSHDPPHSAFDWLEVVALDGLVG